MPRKNFRNIGELQGYEYIRGVIIGTPDNETDTCTVEITGSRYVSVPIFYHCTPDAQVRENGAIIGGAAGFAEGDAVAVLKQRPGLEDKIFVIAHLEGIRPCRFILIVSTKDGAEAIAWDLLSNTIAVEKTSFSGVCAALSGTPVLAEPTGAGTDILPAGYGPAFPSKINGASPYTQVAPVNPDKGAPYFRIDERFVGSGTTYSRGDTVVFQTTKESTAISIVSADWSGVIAAAIMGDTVGAIDATWTITIFHKLFLQFSVKNNDTGEMVVGEYNVNSSFIDSGSLGASYIELDGEDGKTGAYLWYLYSEQAGEDGGADIFAEYYTALSGNPWPVSLATPMTREHVFLNPVFGVPLKEAGPGSNAYLTQLTAATEHLFDSWEQTERYDVGDSVAAGLMHGVASTDKGSIVCDWNTFCFKFTDLVCQDYENKFVHNPHIYFRAEKNTGEQLSFLELINAERVAGGLTPLVINHNLQVAANKHAKWMANNLTMSHIGEGGSTSEDRILAENYLLYNIEPYQAFSYGENVLCADLTVMSIADCVAMWMASPGHHANIMYADFTESGLAAAVGSDGQSYVCQTFGYRKDVWPGFAVLEPSGLVEYVSENFNFTGDPRRVPELYLG